jgi:hypothetical protein
MKRTNTSFLNAIGTKLFAAALMGALMGLLMTVSGQPVGF